MVKDDNKSEFRILSPSISSLLSDDIDQRTLSPLSCLREFETNWLLEFDLPLVNKNDIKITINDNSISVEAKLKESYLEEKLGVKTKFEYFKKTLTLPRKIDDKKTTAKFNKGRLTIKIPKAASGHKIQIR